MTNPHDDDGNQPEDAATVLLRMAAEARARVRLRTETCSLDKDGSCVTCNSWNCADYRPVTERNGV